MTAVNPSLEAQLEKANRKFMRKFWGCFLISAAIYVLCLIFDDAAASISKWVAHYVPSIAKLNAPNVGLNGFAGKYFGVAICIFPFLLLWFCWNENVFLRFRVSQPKSGRGFIETLFFVYILGIPMIAFFFFTLYAAPIDMPVQPRLSGQVALHIMINTYLGLLVFGATVITGMALFGAVLIGSLWLPFSALYQTYFQRK